MVMSLSPLFYQLVTNSIVLCFGSSLSHALHIFKYLIYDVTKKIYVDELMFQNLNVLLKSS